MLCAEWIRREHEALSVIDVADGLSMISLYRPKVVFFEINMPPF
jgi:hypothetical protein